MPLLVGVFAPPAILAAAVAATSLLVLGILGALAAQAGGASLTHGALRVLFWGAIAMAVTTGIGAVFGTIV
jgi:vacuolar iron transporter family protein